MELPLVVLEGNDRIVDPVFPVGGRRLYYAGQGGRDHAAVLNDRGFRAGGVDDARLQPVPRLYRDMHIPFPLFIQG